MFFSYGIIFDTLESNTTQEYSVLIQVFLLIAYTSFIVFGTYYIVKTQRKLNNITSTTNVISITLLAVVFLNIGMYNFQNFTDYEGETNNFTPSENNLKNLPDVYYIVLDEYAPLRTLNMFYDYDNTDFIEFR